MKHLKDRPKKFSKGVMAWALYDWASSPYSTIITTFIFATYFTEAIVKDPILGTHYWGNATALAGIIIAITSPLFGSMADYGGERKPLLFFFTVLTIIPTALFWYSKPNPSYINWTLGCMVMSTIGLELSTVFYNAMMKDLVPKAYLGRLSGFAWGLGYAGGLICLFISLQLLDKNLTWTQLTNETSREIRISGPLVAFWLAVFSIPLFLYTPDRAKNFKLKEVFYKIPQLFARSFKGVFSTKDILIFLLAHMIYIDGLNTLFAFGGIYAAGTFNFKLNEIIMFGISLNITAGIGAFLFAFLDDYMGSKKTILVSLFSMILLVAGLLTTHSKSIFWGLALCLGVFIGPVQSASRSLMAHLSPPEKISELFGFFALTGKVTAFLGPFLVGAFTIYFQSQRAGMSVILVFLLVGALLLLKVKKNI